MGPFKGIRAPSSMRRALKKLEMALQRLMMRLYRRFRPAATRSARSGRPARRCRARAGHAHPGSTGHPKPFTFQGTSSDDHHSAGQLTTVPFLRGPRADHRSAGERSTTSHHTHRPRRNPPPAPPSVTKPSKHGSGTANLARCRPVISPVPGHAQTETRDQDPANRTTIGRQGHRPLGCTFRGAVAELRRDIYMSPPRRDSSRLHPDADHNFPSAR